MLVVLQPNFQEYTSKNPTTVFLVMSMQIFTPFDILPLRNSVIRLAVAVAHWEHLGHLLLRIVAQELLCALVQFKYMATMGIVHNFLFSHTRLILTRSSRQLQFLWISQARKGIAIQFSIVDRSVLPIREAQSKRGKYSLISN